MAENDTPADAPHPAAHLATEQETLELGRTFAYAFADDPVWEWLCGKRFAQFTDSSAAFFATESRRHVKLSGAWTTQENRSGALWAPPGKWRNSYAEIARWAPSAIRVFGSRLFSALSALGEVDKVHPTEPHWYLALLGTHPDHQGLGLGSAALQPVLQKCDSEGTPAYLESSKEANVPFYERHGFSVTSEIRLGRTKAGPSLWLMWREPQPPLDR